jgi:preprotein translocase subunit SecE
MNAKVNNPGARFDAVKGVISVALLLAGVVASTHYAEQPLIYHVLGWIILGCVVVLIAFQTEQGRGTWVFLKEARIELRKVVWPTRQETLQTTLIVILMVVVTALFLWGIDSVLLWLVSLLTGSRG